jgi:hypothetical protein
MLEPPVSELLDGDARRERVVARFDAAERAA